MTTPKHDEGHELSAMNNNNNNITALPPGNDDMQYHSEQHNTQPLRTTRSNATLNARNVIDRQTDIMATLKLKRIIEVNQRLRADLSRDRIHASNACLAILRFTQNTKDFCIPSLWGNVDGSKHQSAQIRGSTMGASGNGFDSDDDEYSDGYDDDDDSYHHNQHGVCCTIM